MSTLQTSLERDSAVYGKQILETLSQELPCPQILATVSREFRRRIGMELRGFALTCRVVV